MPSIRNNCNGHDEDRMISVRIHGHCSQIGTSDAFALAHQMLCRGKFEAADLLLNWLTGILPNDRRVIVLKARCAARQGRYEKCSQLLNTIPIEGAWSDDIVEQLHAAIIYRVAGLFADARNELRAICGAHPNLPSLWLMIGDLWLGVGRPDNAESAWRSAARFDVHTPTIVARAAHQRMLELKKLTPFFDHRSRW